MTNMGMMAWGNTEPCPICGKPFKVPDIKHLLGHPEAKKILFPEKKEEER